MVKWSQIIFLLSTQEVPFPISALESQLVMGLTLVNEKLANIIQEEA